MILFLLAVLCSSLVTILMRASKKHAKNNISMLAVNYVMCTVLGFAFMPKGAVFPQADGAGFALWLGIGNGVLYLASFVLLNVNIRKNGVVLPTTFMKLGAMVPALLAIFVWKEEPSAVQIIGIAAAIAAIVLIHTEKGESRIQSGLGLMLLLVVTGMASSMSKVYDEYGTAVMENHFLLYTFAVALILCVMLALLQKQSFTLMDGVWGLLIGIPNYLSSRFLLLSLAQVPAVIAYPCYSVGSIVLVTLSGVAFFKEKLSRRQLIAIVIILAALAFLNL